MPYQNINATVSNADLQAIKGTFAAIKQKLPFLVNQTAKERKTLSEEARRLIVEDRSFKVKLIPPPNFSCGTTAPSKRVVSVAWVAVKVALLPSFAGISYFRPSLTVKVVHRRKKNRWRSSESYTAAVIYVGGDSCIIKPR